MKLSRTFLELLEHSSKISSGIFIPANTHILAVRNAENSIQLRGTFPDVFPHDVALYDVKRFLQHHNGFSSIPDVDVGENGIVLSTHHSKYNISFADKKYISPVKQSPPVLRVLASFVLSVYQQRDIQSHLKRSAGDIHLGIVEGTGTLSSTHKELLVNVTASLSSDVVRLECSVPFESLSPTLCSEKPVFVDVALAVHGGGEFAVWSVAHRSCPTRTYLISCKKGHANYKYSDTSAYVAV